MSDTPSASSGPTSGAIPAGTYAVDIQRSRASFRAKAFGLMWVRGHIPVREGSITISDGRISGVGLLAADRIDTALGARDWHLRSAHYLDTGRHPVIRVAIDGADLSSRTVSCEVTVRDTPAPVQVELRSVVAGDVLEIEADTTLDRTVYPMLGPWAGVSRRVNLAVTLVARRTDERGSSSAHPLFSTTMARSRCGPRVVAGLAPRVSSYSGLFVWQSFPPRPVPVRATPVGSSRTGTSVGPALSTSLSRGRSRTYRRRQRSARAVRGASRPTGDGGVVPARSARTKSDETKCGRR